MCADSSAIVKHSLDTSAYSTCSIVRELDRTDTPLLTEIERQQLAVWNTTYRDYPQDSCIPQLVERQAAATPDAVALVMDDQVLTYRELNQRANRLAHYLQASGVLPDVLVGICVERSLDMVVGLLGILKAGGAYLPLDPSHPDERLTFMLNDADATVLVTQQYIATRLPIQGIKVVCLDSDAGVLAEESAADAVSAVTADDLAYVIYTSGSTGQPKGVQITHRSLLNLVFWHQQTFEVTASDRATQFASPSFDVTVEELWPYLTIGASVYIPDEGTRTTATLMRDWLVNCGITITMLPTAMVEYLMTLEWPSTTSLRFLLTGGDTLHRYPPPRLPFAVINNYGPTEATVVTTFERVFPTEHATMLPSIGRPIANAHIYILDEHLRQVPIGCQGELYIGGVGLAKGYLNHPELTAEKFIANPFSDEPGVHLYKTGDLACYLPDGQLAFIGRIDYQIKIRGYRIESDEIMTVLNRHPAVQTSVVVAREDIPGNKHLVAYIVVVPGAHITLSSLRSTLLAHLPDYMVPSTFVVLDAFPLTPSGKVDRSALPAPESIRCITEETFVAPRLMVHYQLKAIWEELLDTRPIGIRDNFFYIGGHSLLAARLVDQIEQVLGKKISIATLFAGPTIEGLANALQGQEDTSSRAPVRAIQTGGSKRPFFFLDGQWRDNAFFCFPLARYLGSDQPFYALRPYRFYGPQVPPAFEAMAAGHLKSMRDIQPKGPYLLGGWCNGALVAYEMARQLHAEGEVVDLLVLMDPVRLVYPAYLRLYRAIFSRLGDLVRLGQDKQLDWYLHWYLYLKRLLRLVSRYLRLKRGVKDAEELTFEALRQDYPRLFDWMALGYVPSCLYPGKITFFWTSESKEAKAFRKGWRRVEERNEVEIRLVPGDHITSRTEHLHDLAECLRMCLSKAQEALLSE